MDNVGFREFQLKFIFSLQLKGHNSAQHELGSLVEQGKWDIGGDFGIRCMRCFAKFLPFSSRVHAGDRSLHIRHSDRGFRGFTCVQTLLPLSHDLPRACFS